MDTTQWLLFNMFIFTWDLLSTSGKTQNWGESSPTDAHHTPSHSDWECDDDDGDIVHDDDDDDDDIVNDGGGEMKIIKTKDSQCTYLQRLTGDPSGVYGRLFCKHMESRAEQRTENRMCQAGEDLPSEGRPPWRKTSPQTPLEVEDIKKH